ncbi:hypothetical protein LguiB_009919 [Lonicera macranthoides]
MSSIETNPINKEDNEAIACAMQLSSSFVVPMVLDVVIELGLLKIISKTGQMSPSEMASHLPTKNKDASAILDSIMRLLATHSIVTCSLSNLEGGGEVERLYGLTPTGELFAQNRCTFLLSCCRKYIDTWYHLKDAILEGGNPFERAYGMPFFKHIGANSNESNQFDRAISQSYVIMTKILKTYKGFEGIKSLVDVGGGVGTTLQLITSKYPSIKGVNFDLPLVIKSAPLQNGIEHVAGDMFVSVPRSEAILLKWVCHNWDDEHCLKLLRNCYKALPTSGKVILVEYIMPLAPNTSIDNKYITQLDNIMLSFFGGKERTINEFEALSKAAGFSKIQIHSYDYTPSVVEIFK